MKDLIYLFWFMMLIIFVMVMSDPLGTARIIHDFQKVLMTGTV